MKSTLFILALLISFSGYTQNIVDNKQDKRHKNIYANILGADLLAGIHYDMRFIPGRQDGPGFSAGIGGGAAIIFFTSTTVRMIPIEFNYVVGSGSNSLAIGAGLVHMKYNSEIIFLSESKTSDSSSSPLLSVSYRRQPKNNEFFFQAGLQFTSFDKDLPNPIPLSLSFGYGFK